MPAPLLNYRYRILQALGEGGFGKTFLAEDTQMPSQRRCVIKQLKPMSDRPEVFDLVQQRFAREAAVLETVSKGSEQIPDLFAYFSEGGQFHLVQEWIEGKPLMDLAQAAWPEKRVIKLLDSTLSVLGHIHGQDIIHRDIKPDNIIVRAADGLPCLIDFGAVKELMGTVLTANSAKSSLVIGTPGFMPPEQAAGRPVFSSDLYSLGMTAIYLLTRRAPAEIPTASQTGEVLWRQFAPKVSDELADILTRSVHPYLHNRYPTAADMQAVLKPLLKLSSFPATEISSVSSQSSMPTVAASPASPTVVQSAQSPIAGRIAGTAAQTAAKSSGFPWKRIGLILGASVLGLGVIIGTRPQLSFQSRSSVAEPIDFQQTIATLQSTVQENPDDAAAQVNLADTYREIGDYEGAIAQLDNLPTDIANSAAALLTRGKVKFETGDYEGTIATLSQAIEADSNSAESFNLRGDAYYETGRYDDALTDYRSAIRVDPNNGLAYVNWSAINVLKGNSQEALQNLDIAVERDPNLLRAYVNRGNRHAELGHPLKAIKDWQKAVSMTPQNANDYVSQGYARSRLANKDKAMDDYNQALIINPNLARAHVNRGFVFYEQDKKEQALAEFDKALAVNPNLLTALIVKGEILAYQNNPDWPGAIAAYTQALSVNPNDPDVLNNRCSAYFATKQLDLALADCDKGLKIAPRNPALHVARGDIRLAKENYEGAIQDFSRTIELGDEVGGDPRRQQAAYSNRASARVNVQDLSGALSDVNKALELKDDAPEDYYKRGLIKVALDDEDGARTDMKKAADLYVAQGRTDSHKSVLSMMEQLEL